MAEALTELRNLQCANLLSRSPLPEPKFNAEGERLPASYANFLIINHAVLVPTYKDPMTSAALAVIQRCFPDREVIGIDCLALIEQGGSWYRCTMQIPAPQR